MSGRQPGLRGAPASRAQLAPPEQQSMLEKSGHCLHRAEPVVQVAVLLVLILSAANCFNPFAPELERNNGTGLRITEQKSPDEVLENFVYAYALKDSLVYDSLLDSSFVFVYFDPNLGSSGLFASWNRDVELKTTGRLFRNFETLNLVWDSTIYETLDGSSAELAKTLHLHLFGSRGEYNLTGNAIFNLRKSPYDQKWRITRWKDESQM